MIKGKVLNYINENRMIENGQNIVVGVSGGADSMCLLDILASLQGDLGLSLLVVHIHHGIRGQSADRDAQFVKIYCQERNIPCVVKRYDVPALATQWGMSHEEAGRRVRYEAFDEALRSMGDEARGSIAVAHNADDNAETVLLNMFRGSGLKGMTGIRPVRDSIIRPILCLTRDEIETYNKEHNISYVQDETNFTEEYTRNKIRLGLLPRIKDINPRAGEHINKTAEALSLVDDYMECQAREAYQELVTADETGEKLYIEVDGFANLHRAMQLEVVKRCIYNVAGRAKDITKQHIDSVLALFQMTVGRRVSLPYDMVALRQYDSVWVCKASELDCQSKDDEIVDIHGPGQYHITLAGQSLKLTVVEDTFSSEIFEENQYTKWIDCDIMKCDLQVRTRRDGDYIVIDDRGSRKKLKDFFIDKKIPKEDRDAILVVADGSQIVWVIGHRLSGAYKVSESSEHITKLQIEF